MMLDLGLIANKPRLVVAQAAAANPLFRAYQNNWDFEPVRAQPTLATAIQRSATRFRFTAPSTR